MSSARRGAGAGDARVGAGIGATLALVLALALALRWTTLDIPHYFTDEPWCEALAASLLRGGGYTVEHVGVDVLDHREPGLALLELVPDPRRQGAVLEFYASDGQTALVAGNPSVRAPLFPALLAASVALSRQPVRVVAVNQAALAGRPPGQAYADAVREPSETWRRAQLPVVLPSLLASLASVVLAFVAARALVPSRLAVLAALAVAVAPLDVWCAHRVTADSLTGATLGLFAVVAARAVGESGRRGLALAAASGALAGLAVLSKSSGALALPAFALAELVLLARERARGGRPDVGAALARTVALGAALALLSLWWNALLYAKTGDVFRAIGYGGIGLPHEVQDGWWPRFTRSRGFWVIPASTAVLSPILAAGAVALLGTGARAARRAEGETRATRALLLHAALASAFLAVTLVWPSKENRFLLPAYVPLAAGGALACERARALARRHFGPLAGSVVVAVAVAAVLVGSAVSSRRLAARGLWELKPLER